jgi:hypothetical protein
MNDSPAALMAFWFASEIMPASATRSLRKLNSSVEVAAQRVASRDLTISMQPSLERCGSYRPTVMPGITYR